MPNHGTLTAYLREQATFSRILTGPPPRTAVRADRVTQRVEYVLARDCTLAVNLYSSTVDLESGAVRDERRVGWVVPIGSIDRGRVSVRRKQDASGLWTVALYPAEPGAFAFRQTVEFLRTLIPPDDTTAQRVRSEDWVRFFTLDVANEDAARRIGEAFAASLPECELWLRGSDGPNAQHRDAR
jgi:hypothetical protein